ncbi:transporter substrate-binding domain-containing protein [Magnetospira sp. QH-2]|uniref:transporter substrate-binding domain-containing protein n=1 Tax=Magnetospira sp. (strain QH-2) TaxID=1288970 RepID=UPI00208E189C|nr:transporter substrate-binding domain-containing protein [Magnetospira sp. QH-2]
MAYCQDCIPFHFKDENGKPAGMIIDHWRKWSEKTGVGIEFVAASWNETLEMVRTGAAQVHAGLYYNAERDRYLDYGSALRETETHVFFNKDIPLVSEVTKLAAYRVGVVAGDYVEGFLKQEIPQGSVTGYADYEALVADLESGALKVFAADKPTAIYHLANAGLRDDFAHPIDRPLYRNDWKPAVRQGDAETLALIEKGMAAITEAEKEDIARPWRADTGIGLTPSEREWLAAHPVIQLGSDRAWPPFEYLDDQDRHRGLSAAYAQRLEKILGVTLSPPASLTWTENITRAKDGRIDMLTSVAPTPEREEFLIFTKPYMTWPNVIATRSDIQDIGSVEDLDGLRVGVVAGYAIEEIMKREHPRVIIVSHKDMPEGLLALSTGKTDAFVDSFGTINHYARQMQLGNIAVVAPTPHIIEIGFGVRADWPELARIMDKALSAITPEERGQMLEAIGLPAQIPFAKAPTRAKQRASRVSGTEAVVLVTVFVVVGILLVTLIWLIRGQKRPLLRSLRGKSLMFIVGVFVLVGGSTLWVMGYVSDRISVQFGQYIAERHVLWHKEKVLGTIKRELALSKQMAESEILSQWMQDENDPDLATRARRELQSYHDNFNNHIYFAGVRKSGHFFYADEKVERVELEVVDTLSSQDEDDDWFFASLKDSSPYHFNVDHNSDLGVTNLWINYVLREGRNVHGVVGTGIHLTDFIDDFIASDIDDVTAMMIGSGGAIHAHADATKIDHNVLGKSMDDDAGIWGLLGSDEERQLLRDRMDKLKSGGKGAEAIFLRVDGINGLVALSYLEPLDWYNMAVFEPSALVGLNEAGTLLAALVLAFSISVIAFVVGQNILVIRPLNQLTHGARRLSDGDYHVQLAVEQQDELGDLSRTFNTMAATIDDYTKNLETKVDERTRELSEAYEIITGSIDYASRIQRSVLPETDVMDDDFQDHFIIWEPRDVVGGDLYWHRNTFSGPLIIVADCTGHGVPGAFMGMIATGALNHALAENPDADPARLLQRMNQLVKESLGQDRDDGESDDGLELGICHLDPEAGVLRFAGARFSLFVGDHEGIRELSGDKAGIGYRAVPVDQTFKVQTIDNPQDSTFYMSSDGLIDQIGGDRHRSFGKKRFRSLLETIRHLPLSEQRQRILDEFEAYQGQEVRRDDLCVVGFRPLVR